MRTRYLLLTAIWGASFLFIKLGLEALAPLQIVLARMASGALALGLVMAVRREVLPREPRVWAHALVSATLLNTVPFTLFAYAEQRIPSTIAAICNATTPLFTVLVVLVALPDERPTARRCAGLLLGFAGVFVVLGAWSGAPSRADLAGVALALAAAACYGLGGVYLRRHLTRTPHSGLVLSTVQLAVGTLELAIVVPLATRAPTHLPARAVLAVLALGALGTGLAYVLQHELIRAAGATFASTVTYSIPLVSLGLGAAVLGEPLAWNAPVGAGIVIAGAMLSRATPRRPAAAPAVPPARRPTMGAATRRTPLIPWDWPRGPS